MFTFLKNINKKQLSLMLSIYTLSLIGLLIQKFSEDTVNANVKENEKKKHGWMNKALSKCYFNYKSPLTEKITQGRGCGSFITVGKNKYMDNNTEDMRYCFLSGWSLSHLFTYMLLGYFCPSLFWVTFIIGTFFETFECIAFDCHDILDILCNTAGFGIGYLIQKI